MKQLFTNNAYALLAAPISASSTSLTVMTGFGAKFPNPGPNEYFLVTLENEGATVREIIRVTGRSGDTFTFSAGDRGQEGTTPLAWASSPGNDTLVDHRVTANTMTRAMELPEAITSLDDLLDVDTSTPPSIGQVLIWNGTSWEPGDVVGQSWIEGESNTAISIDPGWTQPVSESIYSAANRGFKFFVTILVPANGFTQTFEILATVRGLLNGTESVVWNRVGRVGDNIAGSISIDIDPITKELELTWTNNEALPVEVACTRIQHGV